MGRNLLEVELEAKMENLLREKDLFSEKNHAVDACIANGEISIGYRTSYSGDTDATRFEIDIVNGTLGYINYIRRSEKLRGQGVGRKLCQIILQFFREMGCKTARLSPMPFSEERIKYYESMGFRIAERQVMEKVL